MPKPEKIERNIEMFERWKRDQWSFARLGSFYNIKKQTCHDIIRKMIKREEKAKSDNPLT